MSMQTLKISHKRHRFPPQVIAHGAWLQLQCVLKLREVEELMLERGVNGSYETIRRWSRKHRLIDTVIRPNGEMCRPLLKLYVRLANQSPAANVLGPAAHA